MLYWLLDLLERTIEPPGFGIFAYISVRSALAAITALFMSLVFGKRIIRWLQRMQLGETIRTDIGLDSHLSKAGTPSMGGIIIILSTVVPAMLWMNPLNPYMIPIVFVTVALGMVGFIDDYLKIIKKDKRGLAGRLKIAGQVLVGLVVATFLYFHPDFEAYHTLSTVPFSKDTNIDYAFWGESLGWVFFFPFVIFVITGVSNAANLTDGLDGLAAGTSAIAAVALAVLAYVSGRIDFSLFLDIMYLPGTGELTIFCSALVGACFGFLWYNTYPAEVFMGDTGSLALGGSIAAVALMVHKELLLPILCGVFFLETLSVILQTTYFKATKRFGGEGKRLFLMAPIHHHFEKKGWSEPKIVVRFWIIAILLALFTIITLKLR
jgi:phospho-N-acetylmuramoyl-pentapeptide-transferase